MPESIKINQEKPIQNPVIASDLFPIKIEEYNNNTPVFKCISLDDTQKEKILKLQKFNDKSKILLANQKSKVIDAEKIISIRKKLGKLS